MKRNNILSYILFALTAFFPVLYVGYSHFLKDYTILFEKLTLWADVLNVALIGISAAMLSFKEKQISRTAKVMLIMSAVLLPVGRFLMARVLYPSYVFPGNLDTVIYIVTFIVLAITVYFYIQTERSKIIIVLIISVIFAVGGSLSLLHYVFSYQKPRTIADIPSPDGVHHIRVIEYADDDNADWLYKAVYSYNSAESFSIGEVEFVKGWSYIEDYPEANNPKNRNSASLDERSDITFRDYGTITIKDKTYTYDGEPVTEPSEPPL